MSHKRGQRRLRSPVEVSLLGDGILERLRSTSLALLGLVAALGLATVALALNQGWPLLAGAPIPDPPPGAEGERSGREKPRRAASPRPPARGDRTAVAGARTAPAGSARPPAAPAAASPPASARPQAVAVSAPLVVDRGQGGRPGRPAQRGESQAPRSQPQPGQSPRPAPVPAGQAEAPPPPSSPPPPAPPPEATISSHPGKGHAYGKGNGNGPPDGVPPGHAGD